MSALARLDLQGYRRDFLPLCRTGVLACVVVFWQLKLSAVSVLEVALPQ